MRRLGMYNRRLGALGQNGAGVVVPASPALVSAPDRNVDFERYVEGRRFKFCYQTPNIASLAAAAQTTNVIQFDLDSVFCWLKTVFFADIAGAVQTISSQVIPLATVLITDTGSGQAFSNAAIPVGAQAGTAQLPFIEPSPQFIQPNTSLQFQWTNYSAATTYANMRLELHGFKIYGVAAPAQL